MKKAAFFGVMVAAVAGLVVVLANTTVSRSDGHLEARPAGECDSKVPGECLPRIGYLDTADTMWTDELLAGKVVMVNFWATWCAPCKHEIPALSSVYKKHRDDGFVLLGVLMDSDAVTDEQLEAFSKQYRLEYPVVRIDQEIFWQFGEPDALPTTFVYDRTGKLRHRARGALSESAFDSIVTRLITEK